MRTDIGDFTEELHTAVANLWDNDSLPLDVVVLCCAENDELHGNVYTAEAALALIRSSVSVDDETFESYRTALTQPVGLGRHVTRVAFINPAQEKLQTATFIQLPKYEGSA